MTLTSWRENVENLIARRVSDALAPLPGAQFATVDAVSPSITLRLDSSPWSVIDCSPPTLTAVEAGDRVLVLSWGARRVVVGRVSPVTAPVTAAWSASVPAIDTSYFNLRYTLQQWASHTTGIHSGGMTLPPGSGSSAWITPGAGVWRITLAVSLPAFSAAACYVYILRNVPGATPYSNASIPSYDDRIRLVSRSTGGGVEVSATVALSASDTITTMVYQATGAAFNLTFPVDVAANSLQFERL